ncbi:hypothetical protein [Streptomyces acidicola]|uniref:Uncharacterized protein n=1 Tax=Streptomyces acidicola TaxID=2596892 RepID=A0A5N8WM83_9ACTN|nr:hypothetical protein [Streptomyces acidicola]MPY47196.1 hypothetical protein [Streptomyces acidicola]MPY47335.1 hypothetical protein [Streptomyces acidicola]
MFTPYDADGQPTGEEMDRQQILDLYTWQPGTCFRHPGGGTVDTALVKMIKPRAGQPEEVRACRDCVLVMEGCRRNTAEQAGVEYEPGHVGEAVVARCPGSS